MTSILKSISSRIQFALCLRKALDITTCTCTHVLFRQLFIREVGLPGNGTVIDDNITFV